MVCGRRTRVSADPADSVDGLGLLPTKKIFVLVSFEPSDAPTYPRSADRVLAANKTPTRR
jgi:hypothetical protein